MREELSDNFVKLRRHRVEEDAPLLYEAVRESIPEISRWLPWCHPGYSIEESREWLAARPAAWDAGTDYAFVIEDAQTGEFLGGGGLSQLKMAVKFANLGYWVRTSRAGRGIATAATLLMARFGFEDVGLERIQIVAAKGNLASQRVAEKAGALREGVLRKSLLVGGQLHDSVLFSLIREDLNL
ncbi:MAG TPA: GNAT family protein [Pyrinomonadaceae bacterium]|nr:GNAT family protein [Pyrinomonadaceae bacterium]